MVGRTKTQKRNLVKAIKQKAKLLFFEDVISVKDLDSIFKVMVKANNKLK